MLYGVAEHRARHPRGVFVEEGSQSPAVLLARLAQPAAGGLVYQVLVIVQQDFGDLERVGHVTLPDEVGGGDDGGPALPQAFGARQLVQDIARFVGEVASDHVWSGEVDKVPVVDPVRAPQVEFEKRLPTAFGRLLAAALLVHDARRAGT